MEILDGNKVADEIKNEIARSVKRNLKLNKRPPHLAAILVGTNGASETYVAAKVKACEKVGFISSLIRFKENISEEKLLKKIEEINLDDKIDGLIVQLPLPKHISEEKIINIINPCKDVDGFHPTNFGKLFMGVPKFVPCTPLGCIYMLKNEIENIKGKNAVIIGRSNIVGKPMASLLLSSNCSVTITHSRTKNIQEHTRKADILIVAVGIPEMIDETYIKPGAIVIDVGINRLKSKNEYHVSDKGILVGDVNFEKVLKIAEKITPVPGGVGPMTIACLMHNTVKAAYSNKKHDFINVLEGIL